MIKIYIDLFFAINYFIDYISLFAVGKILYLSLSRWRYHAGSLFGALYSTIAFFHSPHFSITLLVPLILTLFIAGFRRVNKIIFGAAMFVLCEMMIGGCVIAIRNITGRFIKSTTGLIISILLIAFLSSAAYYFFQRIISNRFKMPIIMATLEHEGKKRQLSLLIDSGNMARDYSTGDRIIFLSPKSLSGFDINSSEEYQTEIYTASGKGIVAGFRPNKITFDDKKYNREKFIVVSNPACANLQGIDGIISLIV